MKQDRIQQVFSPSRQRVSLVAVSILLQAAILVVALGMFSQYFGWFYLACLCISAIASLEISMKKTRLAYKIAWIIPILLVPVVGGLMYFALGGGRKPHYQKTDVLRLFRRHLSPTLDNMDFLGYGADATQQANYLQQYGLFPAYLGTQTSYYASGEDFFPALLEALEQAERYIFLEYFIISEKSSMWREMLAVLERKAMMGVDVRVIYDGVGSASVMPRNYPDYLEELGIQCRVYRPLVPVLSIHQNNRDHRKLCVIDGRCGFVGGLNIADEYVNRIKRFGYWKDNALRLQGEAAWSLAVLFLSMWDGVARTRTDVGSFRPKGQPPAALNGGIVLPYADTPLVEDTLCADLYLQMITKAKRYLYLTTPYLSVDETILSALCTAARSGVDVRIMTPHIPDKKAVFTVTQSNYPALVEAGVRVFEFTPGFLHSKTVVADDLYASVGSCNLDYRSFYLQFENGVWLCGDPSVIAVRDDFLDAQRHCQEITQSDCDAVSPLVRLKQAVYRLFSPLF